MTIINRLRKFRLRLIAVVTVVAVVAAAIVYVVLQIPQYRTAFLVDTAATTTVDAGADSDFNAISDAVGSAAQNVGDSDALSLRRFGGACGDPGNTAQVVGSGTDHGQQISDAVHTLTPGGDTTMQSGILATIDDFSGFYPFRGKKSNRVIVVTSHGTDACTPDQATLTKTIRDQVSAAGLQLDFRFVGYKVPIEQRNALIQAAAATGAPEPKFAQTAADLATILKQLTVPKSPDAAPLQIPGLNTDTQARKPASPPTRGPVLGPPNQGSEPPPDHPEPPRDNPEPPPDHPESPPDHPESPPDHPEPPRDNPEPPRDNPEPPRDEPAGCLTGGTYTVYFPLTQNGTTSTQTYELVSEPCHPNGLNLADMDFQGQNDAFGFSSISCPPTAPSATTCSLLIAFHPPQGSGNGDFSAKIYIPEEGQSREDLGHVILLHGLSADVP